MGDMNHWSYSEHPSDAHPCPSVTVPAGAGFTNEDEPSDEHLERAVRDHMEEPE